MGGVRHHPPRPRGLPCSSSHAVKLRHQRRGRVHLDSATPWLWRYYRDVADEVGDDLGMAPLDATADIWEHVDLPRVPKLVLGGDDRAPSPCHVSFEGEVAWEPDHGLQLVSEHEGRLARVGPHSGHVTVARATDSADPGAIYG